MHIRDMETLPTSIHNEFHEHGHWVIQKTKNRFLAMPIDQALEQNNALMKRVWWCCRAYAKSFGFEKMATCWA